MDRRIYPDDLAARFKSRADSPKYPPEWQYGEDGQPKCTAFVATEVK